MTELTEKQKSILSNLDIDLSGNQSYKIRLKLRDELKNEFETSIDSKTKFASFLARNQKTYGYGPTYSAKPFIDSSFEEALENYKNNNWDDENLNAWYTFLRFLKKIDPICYSSDKKLLKKMKLDPKYSNLLLIYDFIEKQYDCDMNTAMEYVFNNNNNNNNKIKSSSNKKLASINNNINSYEKEKTLLNKKKQIILYGPAGTGKTWITDKLIDGNINELKLNEHFEFTTFHQSFAYEEFIEGIKPKTTSSENISYDVENGIFKELCEKSILSQIGSSNLFSSIIKKDIGFNDAYKKLLDEITNTPNDILELKTKTGKIFGIKINSKNNLNLHTGKDLTKQGVLTKENIFKQSEGEVMFEGWDSYFYAVLERINSYNNKNIDLNENKFNLSKDNNKILLEKFYNLSKLERNNLFETSKPYYLVIDEINRGNISKIFGELITLLESSKRLGEDDELIVELPYSKKKFGVPPNLYIIGTMNTSDKSLTSLDIALRRRFGFIKMLPNPELIKSENEEVYNNYLKPVHNIDLCILLTKLNQRIEILFGEDKLIGHSYFMNLKYDGELENLKQLFFDEIIPLLEEYSYGDINKMIFVLGNDFFTKMYESTEYKKLIKINPDLFDGDDFINKKVIDLSYDGDNEKFMIALNNIIELKPIEKDQTNN